MKKAVFSLLLITYSISGMETQNKIDPNDIEKLNTCSTKFSEALRLSVYDKKIIYDKKTMKEVYGTFKSIPVNHLKLIFDVMGEKRCHGSSHDKYGILIRFLCRRTKIKKSIHGIYFRKYPNNKVSLFTMAHFYACMGMEKNMLQCLNLYYGREGKDKLTSHRKRNEQIQGDDDTFTWEF